MSVKMKKIEVNDASFWIDKTKSKKVSFVLIFGSDNKISEVMINTTEEIDGEKDCDTVVLSKHDTVMLYNELKLVYEGK